MVMCTVVFRVKTKMFTRYMWGSPQSASSLWSAQSWSPSHLAFFFKMQEPLLQWYLISEQVVSVKNKDKVVKRVNSQIKQYIITIR